MAKRYRLTGRDACRYALIPVLTGWILVTYPSWLYGQQAVVPASATPGWKAHFAGAVSLDSLTHYLNRYSPYRLTFDAQKVKGAMIVRFTPATYDMSHLLAILRSATGLSIILHGDHIILQRQGRDANGRDPKGRDPKGRDPKRLDAKAREPVGMIPLELLTDTTVVISAPRPRRVKDILLAGKGKPSGPPPADPVRTGHASAVLLNAGFSANEVLYLNAGGEAGFRWLHLLVSGGTSWHTSTWGIGLGSIVSGNDENEYQVKMQFFPLKVSYTLDSAQSHQILTVKGQLFRGDLLWNKRLGHGWLLKAGPAFSLLTTHYYVRNSPVAPGPYASYTKSPDQQFYLLKPPVVLHNSFNSNAPSNMKYWPGLSVGLYYDLSSWKR